MSQKYVGAILIGDRESDMDRIYGVYLDKDGCSAVNGQSG